MSQRTAPRLLCLSALRGACREGAKCPRVHAEDRAGAVLEQTQKSTALVCAHHLRGACTRADCGLLHITPTTPVSCSKPPRGGRRNPRGRVPWIVRLASQVRGKAKLFDELALAHSNLARLAGVESEHFRRAQEINRQKAEFEGELERLVERLESGIQACSAAAPALRRPSAAG